MKIHSTNYTNAFIEIAEDCPAVKGEIPPLKSGAKTVAGILFELLSENPYWFTSDDVFFQVYALRNELAEGEYEEARIQFFSKGQPCFRASPLTKRYGWGVHSDKDGKVALYGCETIEYKGFLNDDSLRIVKAIKSKR
jgi:hypothetical protein